MSLAKLKSLIENGESETVEFKKSTAQLHGAFQTICAFLNTQGGVVLIGVNEKGQILGQDVTDNTRQEIARELNKVQPHADVKITYISLSNGRKVIMLTVKTGNAVPYVYDDRPYLRNQSTTIRMPREKYESLLYSRKPSANTWEKLISNNCTINDLDINRIQQIVRIAVTERRLTEIAMRAGTQEILRKLDLMVNNKLTNAAVILFCKDEHKQFIQSELKLARFKGLDKSEFLDNKAIRGNAFDLYEHAMTFLRNYLPISGKIEEGNPFRIDTPAIPYKVLREALVNALCHRDYSSPGGSISLAIYDDRVEVSSTGRLPKDISISDLTKRHDSHPRNPLIASVFYACAMIERWGRGTQEMVEICRKSGNLRPEFVELTGSFTVILPLKEPIGGSISPKSIELTPRQKEILKLLEKSALNAAKLSERLKNSPTVRTVQLDLSRLEELGRVVREGKARAMVWKLKK